MHRRDSQVGLRTDIQTQLPKKLSPFVHDPLLRVLSSQTLLPIFQLQQKISASIILDPSSRGFSCAELGIG